MTMRFAFIADLRFEAEDVADARTKLAAYFMIMALDPGGYQGQLGTGKIRLEVRPNLGEGKDEPVEQA